VKLFITGGNGFLGYHIKKELTKGSIDYLAPKSSELNLLNFEELSNYLQTNKPTTILHMAAYCGGILANKNSPADFLRENTQMGLNIYEAARLNDITNVYSLGSVCAYPVNCPIPFKEDSIWDGYPEKTNAPYGQAKRTLLMLGQAYREQYGFTGAHFIPVNMYGEYDHFDLVNSHVIPALINKMTHAKKTNANTVECWGTGNATREFLYGGDCAQAVVRAVISNLDTNLPINLGIGKDISIKDLAYLIAELTDYTGSIVFNHKVSDGQPKRLLDISRAKKLIDWEATTSLRDGLINTIAWYKASH
jgi:nucleoside-diphosphate-sugar epimerase